MIYYRQVGELLDRAMLIKFPSKIQRQIDSGISILKGGGIVAFPTDTVYGLGACATIPQAVARVYQLKERPRNMALPLLLAHPSQIAEVAEPVPRIAWLLAVKFLPGALTLVLYKSSSVPDIIAAGGVTVAVRIPDHPVPVALVQGVEAPIVGTSANLSGKPSAVTADEVYSQFGDKVDLVIDGGRCLGGRESTIVDVTGETPVVLREGAISIEELEKVCGSIVLREGGRVVRIAVGCDHRGLNLKQFVIELISQTGHSYEDFGCYTDDSVDYPDIARKVAEAVSKGNSERGILICSTGIGMSITANKVKGIRAALCHDAFSARRARQHNDANILCLGEGLAQDTVREIVNTFLTVEFEGGRHQRRLDKIRAMEG